MRSSMILFSFQWIFEFFVRWRNTFVSNSCTLVMDIGSRHLSGPRNLIVQEVLQVVVNNYACQPVS